jgi:hypothetical protein
MEAPWKPYVRVPQIWMRPYIPGEDITGVYVSPIDDLEEGGMIATEHIGETTGRRYVGKETFNNLYMEQK